MTNKNIQPASDCTTAGSVPSAGENPTVGQSDDMREFLRVFMLASPRSRSQVCHLMQAYDAQNKRRVFAWAHHWAAFIAINPRAAYRVSPTLRRITRIVCGVILCGVLLAVMTACSGAGDGTGAAAFRATAQAAGVATGAEIDTQNEGAAPVAPTPQPLPTVTPDMQPQAFTQPIVQAVEVAATPTPTDQPAQPLPTVTPDVQGFAVVPTVPAADMGIDESAQPCPARYWKRGTCTATAAQIEAYASEVQP